MREVDLHASARRQVLMARHLAALIVGHREPHCGIEAVEDLGEALGGGLRLAAF